jgi:hypothetical protein
LSLLESLGLIQVGRLQKSIEVLGNLRRGPVIGLPEGGDRTARPSSNGDPSQPQGSAIVSGSGFAGGQHDQVNLLIASGTGSNKGL